MIKKYVAAALLGTALAGGAAFAQTTTPASPSSTAPAVSASSEQMNLKGNWRASKLVGLAVYNDANEKLGDISEILLDNTGKINAVIIGVGGFLGVGSRKIVVDWNALRFGKIANKKDSITLELTKAQVAAAPEYKEDTPIVVLGASGSLQPLQAIQ